MPHPNDPNSNSDEFLKMPAEGDIGPCIDQIPAKALDRAIEGLLEAGALPPASVAPVPSDDLANPSALTPIQPAGRSVYAPANPPPAELDPLNPGKEVWKALEQEAEDEENAKRHKSHLHRPESPEELPDISNL
jgi:hypothetical protein